MGLWAVLLMVAVCVACATAALGLRRCKRWGYWMALAILSINIGGDTIHAVVAHDWRTLVGLPIGGALVCVSGNEAKRVCPQTARRWQLTRLPSS
jgi:uncharacterized membrane protein (DUF2068 family)